MTSREITQQTLHSLCFRSLSFEAGIPAFLGAQASGITHETFRVSAFYLFSLLNILTVTFALPFVPSPLPLLAPRHCSLSPLFSLSVFVQNQHHNNNSR